jgi:hypothetical protein
MDFKNNLSFFSQDGVEIGALECWLKECWNDEQVCSVSLG